MTVLVTFATMGRTVGANGTCALAACFDAILAS
jgi:hypothetical protein